MAKNDRALIFKRFLDAAGVLRDDSGQDSEERQLFKLTLNQLRMVKNVHGLVGESGSGVKLKALAESLDITPAAASEMVETLVSKGVLTRSSSALDRRSRWEIGVGLPWKSRRIRRSSLMNFADLQMVKYASVISAIAA